MKLHCLFLLVLLLLPFLTLPVSSSTVHVPPPSNFYVYFNVTLPEGYKILLSSYSNSSFPLLIFTPLQYIEWINNRSSQAVLVTNVSYGNYSFYLNEGDYVIIINGFNNTYPSRQDYKLYLIPYNVLALISQPRNDSAIGIAVYGLNNKSFCVVSTNTILGFFNISSIYAYNYSFYPQYGSSLQLNAVLKTSNNQSLFLQNVITFITNQKVMSFVVNIWNLTKEDALVNSSTFYYYSSTPFTYSFPLAGYLIINVSNITNGMKISFGYSLIQNGTTNLVETDFFDTVYFPFKGYILIDPYNLTGNYHAYDAELVFGGYQDGEVTTFISLNSSLALYYNSSEGWTPFKSVYTFGLNTGEGATDVHVNVSHGLPIVYVGEENYESLKVDPYEPYLLFIKILPFNYSFYYNSSYKIYFPSYINGSYQFAKLNYILVNGKKVNNGYIIPYPEFPKEITIYVNYSYYYYVNIILPNGTTVSGFYEEGQKIHLPKTFYINNGERLYTNSSIITVVKPYVNYSPNYVKQFKVTINNSTRWVNQGTIITLYSPTIFLFNVLWTGSYNVTNGYSLVVNSSIYEKEVVTVNYTFIIFFILLLVIAGIILVKKYILS